MYGDDNGIAYLLDPHYLGCCDISVEARLKIDDLIVVHSTPLQIST